MGIRMTRSGGTKHSGLRKASFAAAVAVAAMVGLAACSGSADTGAGSSEVAGQSTEGAATETPVVAVSLYPLEFVAEQVGGDRIIIENLATAAGHAHNLELSPAQVQTVADADFTLFLSQGFQPAVEDAIMMADVPPVDAWDAVPEDELIMGDTHVWLAPLNIAATGQLLAEELAKVAPENADYYQENADHLTAEMEQIDQEYQEALQGCQGESFLTSHEAFGYMAQAYGLEQVGVAGIDPEVEPSPARLLELKGTIAERGMTTLFVEPLTSSHHAGNLEEVLEVDSLPLDTMEVQVDPDKDVIDVFRLNLESLKQGLDCAN